VKNFSKQIHVNVSDLANEDDDLLSKTILCDDCWTTEKKNEKHDADASDVSLIAIDNDDECIGEPKAFQKKRKVRLSAENESMNGIEANEHRRSLIISEVKSEKKKFKNQVTSTPASQQLLSGKKNYATRKSNSFAPNFNNNDGKNVFSFTRILPNRLLMDFCFNFRFIFWQWSSQ